MTELNRLLRHLFAPLVAWFVANGYLPEYMQNDATEVLVLTVALLLPYAISWYRDARRDR